MSSVLEKYHCTLATHQLTDEDCKQPISNIHREKISRSYCRDLKGLAPYLGLEEVVATDIPKYLSGIERSSQFLSDWKSKKGSGATYKVLIIALLEIGCVDDAEGVCKILNPRSPVQPMAQPIPAAAAPPTSTLSAHGINQITVKLTPYSHKWKGIGQGLGFTADELSKIEADHVGSGDRLSAMLSAWGHWAPGDARGSTNYASLESLRRAVDGAGLGDVAQKLNP